MMSAYMLVRTRGKNFIHPPYAGNKNKLEKIEEREGIRVSVLEKIICMRGGRSTINM